jgi:hypothetical protein
MQEAPAKDPEGNGMEGSNSDLGYNVSRQFPLETLLHLVAAFASKRDCKNV